MAQVTLSVGGRSYDLMCHAGEERHYEKLAARIDAKAQAVRGAVGGVSESRQLLLAALLLADDLEGQDPPALGPAAAPAEAASDPQIIALLESFADRLETLGEKLEKAGRSS